MIMKHVIDRPRVKRISRKLKKYEVRRGGRDYVCAGAKICTATWYKVIRGQQITIECAERIENFLSTDNIKKL